MLTYLLNTKFFPACWSLPGKSVGCLGKTFFSAMGTDILPLFCARHGSVWRNPDIHETCFERKCRCKWLSIHRSNFLESFPECVYYISSIYEQHPSWPRWLGHQKKKADHQLPWCSEPAHSSSTAFFPKRTQITANPWVPLDHKCYSDSQQVILHHLFSCGALIALFWLGGGPRFCFSLVLVEINKTCCSAFFTQRSQFVSFPASSLIQAAPIHLLGMEKWDSALSSS